MQMVAEYFSISQSDLWSKKKSQNFVVHRQIAMYLCHTLTDESLSDIWSLLGRDCATVIQGYMQISSKISTNEQINNTIDFLKKKLIPN